MMTVISEVVESLSCGISCVCETAYSTHKPRVLNQSNLPNQYYQMQPRITIKCFTKSAFVRGKSKMHINCKSENQTQVFAILHTNALKILWDLTLCHFWKQRHSHSVNFYCKIEFSPFLIWSLDFSVFTSNFPTHDTNFCLFVVLPVRSGTYDYSENKINLKRTCVLWAL